MKSILKRALSLLLCLCTLLCCVVVPTAAESTAEAATVASDDKEVVHSLLLNRDFEDGTAATNGFGSTQLAGNTIKIVDDGDNAYLHWVADSTADVSHGHFNIDISSYLPTTGSVVLRMKIRTTDASSTARQAILARPYDYHHGDSIYKEDGTAYGYNSGMNSLVGFNRKLKGLSYVGSLSFFSDSTKYVANEFFEVAFVFSWTDKSSVSVQAFYDGSTSADESYTMASYGVDSRPAYFRFQVNNKSGLSWDLDDLRLYTTQTTDAAEALSLTFNSVNKGSLYNAGADVYVDPDQYNGHYFLKVGVDRVLLPDGSTVRELTYAPFELDGEIYIPVQSLIDASDVSPDTAAVRVVNGMECVALSDISIAYPGTYPNTTSMGLFAVASVPDLFTEGAEETLIPVMQKFVFEHVDGALSKVEAFEATGTEYTDHPYILADQNKFDELRAIYLDADGSSDPTHKQYISNRVSAGISIYNRFANEASGTYSSMKTNVSLVAGQGNINNMPYLSDAGYDIGGRQNNASGHTSNIMALAFTYQITREDKYALLAYDYAVALGNWEHWGPGHFLNCADAAAPYAIAFDWLYDAWAALGLDVDAIAEVIFTHALIPGYYSVKVNSIPEGWMRRISGSITKSGWGFNTSANNWNAVCASGMVIASLAIAGYTTSSLDVYIDTSVNETPHEKSQLATALGDHTGLSTYRDYANYLINQCFFGLEMYGLEQYVPDGSYIESNGYWSYGTNNLFEMVAAVSTATGYVTGESTDFGLMDAWGLDRTCYYAMNTQSGDYKGWNYHDSSSTGAQDTSWFSFVGGFTGNTDLCKLRNVALASGKSGSPTIQDAIFYQKSTGSYEIPALQYHMEGINGYVVRDSWDSGSIYAGILGDTNNLGHGQIDSGSFVYHNGGTIWFCDLGTENYNCYGFWGSTTRYRYYKMSAEGNNTLFLASRQSSVPYGQALNGFGVMTEVGDNKYGAYSIIDNTSAYAGFASSAYRGMLLTNDRRTLVIQDEVVFPSAETAYWAGHTQQNIILSTDGTTAYLYDGNTVIRVTIIDKNDLGLKFEIEDAYTFHLTASEGMDELANEYYELGTHEKNNDRSSYRKLVIKCENVTEISLAVVIEEVAIGELSQVGYEWVDIASWDESTPSANGRAEYELVGSFDGESALGTTLTSAGNLTLTSTVFGSGLAYAVNASASSAESAISFVSKKNLSAFGFLGDRIIAAEVDVATSSVFPAGARISVRGTGQELAGVDLSRLEETSTFSRLTIIVDGGSGSYAIFFGDSLVDKGSFTALSIESLRLTVSAPLGAISEGSVILDNIKLRVFDAAYTGLDAALAGDDITLWAARSAFADASPTPLCSVTVMAPADDAENDTPIVDVDGEAAPSSDTGDVTLVEKVIAIYRWSELEKYINDCLGVTLYASNTSYPVSITAPVTVNTNGYKWLATSESLIARVDGDTVSYEKGSITVTFVTSSGSYTEVYTGSIPATYKGTLPTSKITEVKTDYGYAYYVKRGWSLTDGGEAAVENDMIVTSDNCTFYQADVPYDGLFVTVKGSTVIGYTNANTLFSSLLKNSYDRISLVNDIVFDSSSISHATGMSNAVNIYLNGHTISYSSTASSDHMFLTGSGALSVYGPGTVTSDAASSNILMANGTGKVLFDGVTLRSPRAITDNRCGYTEFRNCDIYIENNAAAFGVTNRNNVHTTDAKMPYLYINGCTINMPYATSTQSVFSITCNSRIEVGGGTVINIGGGGGSLVILQNSTIGTVSGFDYANAYQYMAFKIGDITHNCKNLVSTSTNDSSGNTYADMADKVGYIDGARLDGSESVVLYDGCVIARDNAGYVVSEASGAVSVTWVVGSKTLTESWVKGSTPTPDAPGLVELLETAPEGKRYSFDTAEVTGDTTFTAYTTTDFPTLMNLSLHEGFTVNVYLGLVEGVTYKSALLGDEALTLSTATVDGVEYTVVSFGLGDPSHAAEIRSLNVIYSDTGSGATDAVVTVNVSVLDYAESIIADASASEEARALMVSVLRYLKTAYDYYDRITAPEYNRISSLLASYSSLMTVAAVERQEIDSSALKKALTGAALELGDGVSFRLYVSSGFNGSITVGYSAFANLSQVTKSFDTQALPIDEYGRRYIDLDVLALDLTAPLSLEFTSSGITTTAEYSLAAYYHGVAKDEDALTYFMNALYAYSECARLYQESVA